MKRIAIGVAAFLVAALVPAGVAAADDFNTRAGGQLITGSDVQLVKSSFDVHAGNEKCASDSDPPGLVPTSSTRSFCYQANGFAGEGKYDTELWFRYAILVPASPAGVAGALINDLSKRCLDLPARNTDDGTPLQMFSCNNTVAQSFDLTDARELRVMSRCVDQGSGDAGTVVRIRPCNGGSDQRWRVDDNGRLVAQKNRCIDIADHSTNDSARLVLADCDAAASERWFVPSGYAADGHVKVPTVGDTELSCSIARVDGNRPARRFSCQTSTVRDIRTSFDPGPKWTVTGGPIPPSDADHVVFIGDSVTAGFGYCGAEGGSNSDRVSCGVNGTMANSWYLGDNSLVVCQPVDAPTTVNDRCSNNNFRGAPWDAGPWADQPTAPTIAYPFVIAKTQRPAGDATVEDWAMTGSTPKDWDPDGGAFGPQLQKIKNSYVAMTLGANPLLSDYLHILLATVYPIKGVCASSTRIVQNLGRQVNYYAAPLDAEQHSGKWGVLHCFDEQWNKINQGGHLLSIYKALLERNNHVLVMGYPAGCPWSFGDWQPDGNLVDGPAKGYACDKQTLPRWDGNGRLSQWDQAKAIGEYANGKMERLAAQAGAEANKPGDIRFVRPDQDAWSRHQAWNGDSWIFKNDTWVHPSVAGHEQLARTVTGGMCDAFGHWCGSPPHWK